MEKTIEKNELSCALCNAEPHVYCQSDEAFLCYTCDAHVHRANFLVTRHARAILCCKCKISTTRLHASGPSVDKVLISTCDGCADTIVAAEVEESVSDSGSDPDLDLDLNLNSCQDEEEEEEEENCVVPVSVTGWKRRRVSHNGLEDQEDNINSSESDDDAYATSLRSDSNPRAHKRSFKIVCDRSRLHLLET